MCTPLCSGSDYTLTKRKSKCHRGRLGLLRCVVSSVATGDIWASEEQITEVHQLAPSRPTGCLRHGNEQRVPPWPVMPERSRPNRASSATRQKLQRVVTHSVEDASVSAPSPDWGTTSSSRAAEWGLSLPCLATWSSSETKNWGGNIAWQIRLAKIREPQTELELHRIKQWMDIIKDKPKILFFFLSYLVKYY